MTEFKENQQKRHSEFMDHLSSIEQEQSKRTSLLKMLTEKLMKES